MGITLIYTALLFYFFNISKGYNTIDFASNNTQIVDICPIYGQIEHGTVTLLENDFSVQKTAHIECNKGYDLVGPPKIFCADGQWEQHIRPQCIARCHPPPYIKNGALEIEGEKDDSNMYRKGALAAYTCGEGYVLSPPDSKYRVCEKGIWTGAFAICASSEKISGCKPPKDIANGYFVHEKFDKLEGYSIGQRIHYSCNSGYVLFGTTVQQCLDDGTWSPKIPPICTSQITG